MKYDKYNYATMDKLDYTKSVTALAKEIGCSRQHFYKLKETYLAEKEIATMREELKQCKAKLKAI